MQTNHIDTAKREIQAIEDRINALTARKEELQIFLKISSSLQPRSVSPAPKKAKPATTATPKVAAKASKPQKAAQPKSGKKAVVAKSKAAAKTVKKANKANAGSKTVAKKTPALKGESSSKLLPMSQQIINASIETLKQKSPMKPVDLLPAIEARGVKVNGKTRAKQLRKITVILSATKKLFKSDRQLGWSLVEAGSNSH